MSGRERMEGVDNAAREVCRALTVYGASPATHSLFLQNLAHENPVLARALVKLIQAEKMRVPPELMVR